MKTKERGVSLIEVILVVVILGLMVFLMASLPNAMGLVGKSRHISLAREIATKQIEDTRAISYINLTNGSANISDPRIGLLPNGSGTVLVEDCNSEICTQSENIKQVLVTINWKEGDKPQSITLKTLIGEGGLNQ